MSGDVVEVTIKFTCRSGAANSCSGVADRLTSPSRQVPDKWDTLLIDAIMFHLTDTCGHLLAGGETLCLACKIIFDKDMASLPTAILWLGTREKGLRRRFLGEICPQAMCVPVFI